MLVIRKEQIEALSQYMIKSFEDRMVVHLNEFFPEQCEALGEIETRAAIRYGIQRAANYDIVTQRDLCNYTDLMFAFGRDFDTDPKLPWASQILNERDVDESMPKIDRLHAAAMENIEQACGIDHRGEEA